MIINGIVIAYQCTNGSLSIAPECCTLQSAIQDATDSYANVASKTLQV